MTKLPPPINEPTPLEYHFSYFHPYEGGGVLFTLYPDAEDIASRARHILRGGALWRITQKEDKTPLQLVYEMSHMISEGVERFHANSKKQKIGNLLLQPEVDIIEYSGIFDSYSMPKSKLLAILALMKLDSLRECLDEPLDDKEMHSDVLNLIRDLIYEATHVISAAEKCDVEERYSLQNLRKMKENAILKDRSATSSKAAKKKAAKFDEIKQAVINKYNDNFLVTKNCSIAEAARLIVIDMDENPNHWPQWPTSKPMTREKSVASWISAYTKSLQNKD